MDLDVAPDQRSCGQVGDVPAAFQNRDAERIRAGHGLRSRLAAVVCLHVEPHARHPVDLSRAGERGVGGGDDQTVQGCGLNAHVGPVIHVGQVPGRRRGHDLASAQLDDEAEVGLPSRVGTALDEQCSHPRHLPGERFDEASARHLAGSGCDSGALPTRAGVGEGTGVGVVAGQGVVHVRTAAGRLAAVGSADVVVVAVGRRAADAGAVGAGVVARAGVFVVRVGPVGLVRVRAHATHRVAGAGDVALIERGAGDGGGRAPAGAVLARLPARAGVVVVTGGPVGLVRVRAHATHRVAGAGDVALIERGAGDGGGRAPAGAVRSEVHTCELESDHEVVCVGLLGVREHATLGVSCAVDVALIERGAGDGGGRAPAGAVLALPPRRSSVLVVTGGPVGLVRVRAHATHRVAGAGDVALIERGAGDGGGRAPAGAVLARLPAREIGRASGSGSVGLVRVRAHATHRVAGAGDVALIERGAGDGGGRAPAGAVLVCLAARAVVVVVVGGLVACVRLRAHATHRVAGAGDVALIERGAGDGGGRAPAGAVLARLPAREIGRASGSGSVGLVRVRAHATHRVAGAGDVALIERGAGDGGGRAPAGAVLVCLAARAVVVVVVGGLVACVRLRAHATHRVAGAGDVALIERGAGDGGGRAPAGAVLARLPAREIGRASGSGSVGLVRVRAHATHRVAGAGDVALIERGAGDGGGRAPAGAVLVCLAARAVVVVVVGGLVACVRLRAHATHRVAGAGDVALIERGAGDGGGRAPAGAVLARLPARAGVVVVAGGPRSEERRVGHASHRVAGAGDVARIERGAGDGGGRAPAGAVLARLPARAGVVVVTGGPVGLVRVRSHAAERVAGAGDVALIERGAGDGGGRAPAGAVLARLPARAGVVVVAGGPVGLVRSEERRVGRGWRW